MNTWTDDDIRYLKKWYGKKSPAVMSRHLGRSKKAIRNYAYKHGLASRSRWTEKEDEYLEKWYGIRSIGEIANSLGRTELSIPHRARTLGLGTVKDYTDGLNSEEVARVLGVTSSTVRRWTAKDLKSRRCGKYVLINIDDLTEWMKKNPERYQATKCEKYMFENYKWFHEKLLLEREHNHNQRWGIAN